MLEEAYAADPKSFEANNNLADAYNRKGLFDKAVFHWEISLNLAPQNTVVRMNLAKAYFAANRIDAAKDAYNALIKLDKSQWDAYYELGKLYATMDDGTTLKEYWAISSRRSPTIPSAPKWNRYWRGYEFEGRKP